MRKWNSHAVDDGTLHALGNGRLAVYEQGPNINQVFGPPYSSPSFLKLVINESENVETHSYRETGTAIWTHRIYRNQEYIGEITDFVDWHYPCLIRKIVLKQSLKFKLVVDEDVELLDNGHRYASFSSTVGLLAVAKAGRFIYGRYPTTNDSVLQVIGTGSLNHHGSREGNIREWWCGPGESLMYLAGGRSYPECVLTAEEVLSSDYNTRLSSSRDYWKKYSSGRISLESKLRKDIPLQSLMEAIDDYSVLVKAQQGIEGGIMAGHNYHLGYIRDQYGAFRCLLKLGHYDEAKEVLRFYWNTWHKSGFLKNAQGIGRDGLFHVHENDDVEITGYLIIQAFDYLKQTNDEALIKEICPMLEWAWTVQTKHLACEMLPFNGDETYIACGILPRDIIYDGSAEATMLFIIAGEVFLEWLKQNQIWEHVKWKEQHKIWHKTMKSYRINFWNDNKVMTNNPNRKKGLQLPRFRHGVCESCSYFGWTENDGNNRYVCASCMSGSAVLEEKKDTFYYLPSVSLMHLYMGSTLFSREELARVLDDIIIQYERDGSLPSKPNSTITLGYDYGLFLYGLTVLQHPLSNEIFEKILSIRDSVGAWTEYYINEKPQGTRYRPWEGGMNLESAIHYAMNN
ncbi:hypothetical protein B1748_02120 [Paenibacillus sp. MY03]|uniref:hypothetical protein n=1 Tax=Paenibacillus sp. MY03 TaxID=302980 RepID=UPI000B3CDD07|nr:hypothetical protein [Paenibacillus sp. MY03]OUS78414.1 hypothetical protein B1748_02120 [Paenibacillus sp. MY03]